MTKLAIYGEAQFARTLKDNRLHLVLIYDTDNKSESILRHLTMLEGWLSARNVSVLLVGKRRLPDTYYRRRAITSFPTVAFYIGQSEVGRSTGIHTEHMLKTAVERHLMKLPQEGALSA